MVKQAESCKTNSRNGQSVFQEGSFNILERVNQYSRKGQPICRAVNIELESAKKDLQKD